MSEKPAEATNPHYLDHVVATAGTHEVEVTEDIVAGNGVKLLAKGARIDADARERLLQHKLRKPLEECVQVVGGAIAARLEPAGEALLEKHPLLRALCAPKGARGAAASLAALPLSMPIQSLLTVYAQHQDGRLDHAVGVAMLALSLARKLQPGDVDRHRVLATAGLLHDVGELYIDPAYLQRGTRLGADQWRHIVTHPLVGHRVLRDMAGAGREVADAVLLHHERLDGFGYPRGVSGSAVTLGGEILAAAEWLMAVVESDSSPLTRAGMAARLVPGEFSAALLEAVAIAAREAPDAAIELSAAPPLEQAVPRVVRLADTLRRFVESRAWIDECIAGAGPALRAVLEAGLQRTLRIQASFASTGMDAHNAALLLGELSALRDPSVYAEIVTLVGELEWRMRELERSQRLRASLLTAAEEAVVGELVARLKGTRV
jgi:HD-GYP domain-containing protein (c-di-GMP phosphodiesterase class II)